MPQWITTAIAGGALLTAVVSIKVQREIARKRAAMDFFTKTEMDKHTLEAYKDFTESVAVFKEHLLKGRLNEFKGTHSYWAIRDYLNFHELMAVGINRNVFDDFVCFDFWSGELSRAVTDTRPLIEYIQNQPNGENVYIELLKVEGRWSRRRSQPGHT